MPANFNPLKWLDANLERYLIIVAYATMTTIIFVEVIQRFVFKQQAPWSTTVPVYLFIWITWIGAAYNVRQRSHLAFTEFRASMPYVLQFLCVILDHVLWIGFSAMVVYYAIDLVQLLRDNYAIVPGTDDIMQWWFYLAIPVGWTLLAFRAFQNIIEDIRRFARKEPFVFTASIGGD